MTEQNLHTQLADLPPELNYAIVRYLNKAPPHLEIKVTNASLQYHIWRNGRRRFVYLLSRVDIGQSADYKEKLEAFRRRGRCIIHFGPRGKKHLFNIMHDGEIITWADAGSTMFYEFKADDYQEVFCALLKDVFSRFYN